MSLKQIVGLGLPAVALIFTGCETPGGGDQVQTAIFDTQRRVARMDNTLESSVAQLNQTTATLTERVNQTEQQTRRVNSLLEENQSRLDQIQQDLTTLTRTLYERWNLTPPAAAARPAAPEREVDIGDIVIESPGDAPATRIAPPEGAGAAVPAGNHEAEFREARAAWMEDDFPRALQLFTRYLEQHEGQDPEVTAEARFWRSRTLLKLNRYEDAIHGFEQMRRQHPTSNFAPSALHNEAVAYARLGQYDQAEQLLQEVINNYPATSFAEESRLALEQLRAMR